jgi:cobalt-zinc-cadmium efflux system membrane fusion protein
MRIWKDKLALSLSAALTILSCAQTPPPAEPELQESPPVGQEVVRLSREALAATPVQIVPAERRPLGVTIDATAVVELNADRVAHIAPRIPGRVVQTLIQLGQAVRRGEPLVILDSVELGEAKSAFRKARVRLEVAQSGYEREKRLYEEGRISSEKEMLEARGTYLEARAEFEATEERLHLYGLSQEVIEQIGVAHDPEASHFPVAAPLVGTVIEKHLTLGEIAHPEESFCTIADLSTLWIILNIYEKDIARVHPGQEAVVRVDAYPGETFGGRLTYISPVLDGDTRTAAARVELENLSGELKPGMFATVSLQTDLLAEALLVPEKALQREGSDHCVFVATSDTSFVIRAVEPGRSTDGWVEITAGLNPGEPVVAEGSFILKSELAKASFGEE